MIQLPGQPVGNGLSIKSAIDLGLSPGTPVATSLIDAHAGGLGKYNISGVWIRGVVLSLGMIGGHISGMDTAVSSCLAVIAGTSTCLMAVSVHSLTS